MMLERARIVEAEEFDRNGTEVPPSNKPPPPKVSASSSGTNQQYRRTYQPHKDLYPKNKIRGSAPVHNKSAVVTEEEIADLSDLGEEEMDDPLSELTHLFQKQAQVTQRQSQINDRLNRTRDRLRQEGRCWQCNEVGHMKFECPNLPAAGNQGRPSGNASTGSGPKGARPPQTAQQRSLGTSASEQPERSEGGPQ